MILEGYPQWISYPWAALQKKEKSYFVIKLTVCFHWQTNYKAITDTQKLSFHKIKLQILRAARELWNTVPKQGDMNYVTIY